MEKEKKKFNLSSLLRIYLGKKSKGLDCPSCRPPPTAGPAPPPGGAWTVKLSQINNYIIYVDIPAAGYWGVFLQRAFAQREEPQLMSSVVTCWF